MKKKTMKNQMKTNKDKNTEYDARVQGRIRPKLPMHDFQPLEAVIRQWITAVK